MPRRTEHHLTFVFVNRVLDGDTFVVESGPIGYRVRVADCNTPERGAANWREAKDFTTSAVQGQWVGLANRNQQWDRYGRRLGVVYYGKDFDKCLATDLIAAGLAVEDPTTATALMEGAHPPSDD